MMGVWICLLAVSPWARSGDAMAGQGGGAYALHDGCTPALDLVKRFHMGKVLLSSASAAAHGTVTYGVLIRRYGPDQGERRLQHALAAWVPIYQVRWNNHLANVYCRLMTADQLRSLARLGKASPAAMRFRQLHDEVLKLMKPGATTILVDFMTSALREALGKGASGGQGGSGA